jgi:hypothetical protein
VKHSEIYLYLFIWISVLVLIPVVGVCRRCGVRETIEKEMKIEIKEMKHKTLRGKRFHVLCDSSCRLNISNQAERYHYQPNVRKLT